jgi:hypothetical protein
MYARVISRFLKNECVNFKGHKIFQRAERRRITMRTEKNHCRGSGKASTIREAVNRFEQPLIRYSPNRVRNRTDLAR